MTKTQNYLQNNSFVLSLKTKVNMLLYNVIMGVFLDSLGEVGCMVSVSQARLCKNGNLNLNANKISTSNFAYAA